MRTQRAARAISAQNWRISSSTAAITLSHVPRGAHPRSRPRRRRLRRGWLSPPAAGGGAPPPPAASTPAPDVPVALDFTPNAVHAPIYQAVRNGRDRQHGVRLHIRTPGSGPDSLKLVAGGKVDLGVLDIQDLAIARAQGTDVVAVGALIDRPLAALIAQPEVARPRDLEGRTVGVSGLPSDPAFVSAIVSHDGGDPKRINEVTIGFAAVSRLLTRRVDAVPAFWNAEGVALRQRGRRVREFRVEDYGAPAYPEVVLITARRTLAAHRQRIAGALAAIADGERATLQRPGGAVTLIAK